MFFGVDDDPWVCRIVIGFERIRRKNDVIYVSGDSDRIVIVAPPGGPAEEC